MISEIVDPTSLFEPDPKKPTAGKPQEPYRWLLIDGGGLAVTAWVTHRTLERPEDRVKAAVYVLVACMASLSRLIGDGAKIIVAWDGADNRRWRRAYHPWYKHGRGSVVDRREVQVVIEKVRHLLKALGIADIQIDGREADDVVATLANQIDEHLDETCLIFSDDRDYVQLVDWNVHLCRRSLQGIILTPEQCELMGIRYGLDYLHMKAMMGDSGDNIRGLKGIGEVKAAELVDRIPDFMATAISDPDDLEWGRLQDKTRRAFVKAGRILVSPAVEEDPEFAESFRKRFGIQDPPAYDLEEAPCLRAAAEEAVRCLNLVTLDLSVPGVGLQGLVFPEPNVERIPSVLKSLDLQDETDMLSAIYTLAKMRNPSLTPPRTSAVRAGAAVDDRDDAAPWTEF